MTDLQTILKDKRKKLGLSLREAGELIGISHSYLSTLEKGKDPRNGAPIKPTPETLQLISKAYSIEYRELMRLAGYLSEDDRNPKKTPEEKYPNVTDVEEAMEILLNQPGLMLKGEALEDEDKIILANAIQAGLRMADEIRKKRREQEGKDDEQYQ